MPNIFWFVTVAVISIGISAYAIYMKRDIYKVSTLLSFYLFSAAITWIGEFVVLGLFNSYAYKTGVFQDPWAQNLLAHLILNTTMFPVTSTVIIVYNFRYRYMALVSIIFVLVEYLFAQLGLFEHHWWRYYMSVININVFMIISKNWFYKMQKHPIGSRRAIIFYFIALIVIHTPTPILLLLGKQHFSLDFVNRLVGNFYRSSTLIAFTYHLIAPLAFTFFVCVKKNGIGKQCALFFL